MILKSEKMLGKKKNRIWKGRRFENTVKSDRD